MVCFTSAFTFITLSVTNPAQSCCRPSSVTASGRQTVDPSTHGQPVRRPHQRQTAPSSANSHVCKKAQSILPVAGGHIFIRTSSGLIPPFNLHPFMFRANRALCTVVERACVLKTVLASEQTWLCARSLRQPILFVPSHHWANTRSFV